MTPIDIFEIVKRGLMGSDIGHLFSAPEAEVLVRAHHVLNMMVYNGSLTKWDGLKVYVSESAAPRRMLFIRVHEPGMGLGHIEMTFNLEDMTRNNLLVLETMES